MSEVNPTQHGIGTERKLQFVNEWDGLEMEKDELSRWIVCQSQCHGAWNNFITHVQTIFTKTEDWNWNIMETNVFGLE